MSVNPGECLDAKTSRKEVSRVFKASWDAVIYGEVTIWFKKKVSLNGDANPIYPPQDETMYFPEEEPVIFPGEKLPTDQWAIPVGDLLKIAQARLATLIIEDDW